MATIYGTRDVLEGIRTLIVAELSALKTYMASNAIDPAIASVHSVHHGDPALTFPAVSAGLTVSDHDLPAAQTASGGPVIVDMVTAEIRIMIGNRNAYMDEIKIARLMQSVMNWMQEQRALSSDYRIWNTMRTENAVRFEDTDTIGGVVTMMIHGAGDYTAA